MFLILLLPPPDRRLPLGISRTTKRTPMTSTIIRSTITISTIIIIINSRSSTRSCTIGNRRRSRGEDKGGHKAPFPGLGAATAAVRGQASLAAKGMPTMCRKTSFPTMNMTSTATIMVVMEEANTEAKAEAPNPLKTLPKPPAMTTTPRPP